MHRSRVAVQNLTTLCEQTSFYSAYIHLLATSVVVLQSMVTCRPAAGRPIWGMTTILECCWHNTDSLDRHRSTTTTRRSSDGFNCGFVALIGRRTTALDEDWGLGPSTSGMQPFVPFFPVPLSSPFCSSSVQRKPPPSLSGTAAEKRK